MSTKSAKLGQGNDDFQELVEQCEKRMRFCFKGDGGIFYY
jgi:hypothetical protein